MNKFDINALIPRIPQTILAYKKLSSIKYDKTTNWIEKSNRKTETMVSTIKYGKKNGEFLNSLFFTIKGLKNV